jgi:hypothetical protein
MKAPIISLLAASLLAGCGAIPFRYDGPDAATIAGQFKATAAKSIIVEVNGERRDPPFSTAPIKVRPGLLRVGLNLHNVTNQLFAAQCFELHAAPGSFHRFSVSAEKAGFLVSLYEGEGENARLVGTALVPFRPLGNGNHKYCDGAPTKS